MYNRDWTVLGINDQDTVDDGALVFINDHVQRILRSRNLPLTAITDIETLLKHLSFETAVEFVVYNRMLYKQLFPDSCEHLAHLLDMLYVKNVSGTYDASVSAFYHKVLDNATNTSEARIKNFMVDQLEPLMKNVPLTTHDCIDTPVFDALRQTVVIPVVSADIYNIASKPNQFTGALRSILYPVIEATSIMATARRFSVVVQKFLSLSFKGINP